MTGFMWACINDSLEIVHLLIDRYSFVIDQKNNNGNTGFLCACFHNKLKTVRLLIDKYPYVINQKDNYGETGYDKLSKDSKLKIHQYISKKQLDIRKPTI